MDSPLRAALKTLSADTRAMSQRGLGVAQEYRGAQTSGYALDGTCHDAHNQAGLAGRDTYDDDSSGYGLALKADLDGITAGQTAYSGQCTTANKDRSGWNTDLATLRARYAALAAAMGTSPLAQSVAQSLIQGMQTLDKALNAPQIDPNASDLLGNYQGALASAYQYAAILATDKSPDKYGKGGHDYSAQGQAAAGYVQQIDVALNKSTFLASNAALSQTEAARQVGLAAEIIYQASNTIA
jgi:hypothetical protein